MKSYVQVQWKKRSDRCNHSNTARWL